MQPLDKNGKRREEIIENQLAFSEKRKLHISHRDEEILGVLRVLRHDDQLVRSRE